MADYTPGPWEIGKGIAFAQSIYAGRVNVAFARQDNGRIDASTAEANARLIAATPELLAQLEWAESVLKCFIEGSAQLESLRATIAKAKGSNHAK